ncbi:multicopper oxidase family protein [Streptomyces antibioticus]|uniref:multicopper oxidase family protein n=1 Tax=Streptomyces antibioticus TaxID=1890 RepID=UPI0033A62FE5
MVENLFEQNLLWAVLAAVCWLFAARGARRLATRPHSRALRRRARLGLVLLVTALLTLTVRAALGVALAAETDWWGATDFLLLAVAPQVIVGAVVAWLSVPAYWRLTGWDRAARRSGGPGTGAGPGGPGTGDDTADDVADGARKPTEPYRAPAAAARPHTTNPAPMPTPARLAAPSGRGTAALTRTGRPTTTDPVPTPTSEAGTTTGTEAEGATPTSSTVPTPAPSALGLTGPTGRGTAALTRTGRPTTTDPVPTPASEAGTTAGIEAEGATPTSSASGLAGPADRGTAALTKTEPPTTTEAGTEGAAPAPAGPTGEGTTTLTETGPPTGEVGSAAQGDVQGAPTPVTRSAAADPRLVVPVRVGGVAVGLGALFTLHPPAPPYTAFLVLEMTLLALAASGLVLVQQRRRVAVGAPGWRPASRGRRLVRSLAVVTCGALLIAGGYGLAARESRLPDRMATAHHHAYDTGGGPGPGAAPARSVTDLTGPSTGAADRRFTLTAGTRTVRLASGETVDALTFNGVLPGPELRVGKGELVEVTLINQDVTEGVTVHWHGVDVPNAEDGVAGVTQDAVRPGGRHVYRFRANRTGTFWYHAHQQSSTAVARGLFGALVVTDAARQPAPSDGVDRTVVAHAWSVGDTRGGGSAVRGSGGALSGRNGLGGDLRTAFGDDTGEQRERVAAGTPVRLRLVNADNCPRTYALTGTSFQVAAIDGNEVSAPTDLDGTLLRVAGGGRYDLMFRQPQGAVRLTVTGDANAGVGSQGFEGCGEDGAYGTHGTRESPSLILAPDTASEAPAADTGAPLFDPLHYGTATGPRPLTPDDGGFDRDFRMVLGNSVGFYDGAPMMLWTVNNAVYPDIPSLLVGEGDLVRVTFLNRSLDDHPMHLHGHRMLVLSRDGERADGSPWWTDTLNVAPGERYEIAFRADNPGVWADHCHNLDHARDGMVLHLAYDGVSSPYETGASTGNTPE